MKSIILLIITILYPSLSVKAQWICTSTPFEGGEVNVIAQNNNSIFIAEGPAFYHSQDSGKSWNYISNLSYDVNSIHFSNNKIFAGTSCGLYQSENNGITWTICSTGYIYYDTKILTIQEGIIYIGIGNNGIFKSNNNGNTWVGINNGISNTWVNCLLFKNDTIIAGSNDGMYYTLNHGQYWQKMDYFNNKVINVIVNNDASIFAGTNTGIYKSTDIFNWQPCNIGNNEIKISSLVIKDSILYAGTPFNGIFKSENNGLLWENISIGNSCNNIRSIFIYNDNVFVGANYVNNNSKGGLYSATINEDEWSLIGVKKAIIKKILCVDSVTYAISEYNVFKRSNGDNFWQAITPALTNKTISTINTNNSFVCLGTNAGIFISEINSTTWHELSNASTLAVNHIDFIDSTIFVATSNEQILVSQDNGLIWNSLNTGYNLGEVFSLTIYSDTILAATQNGIFASENKGNTWHILYYDSLFNTHFYDIIQKEKTILAVGNLGIYVTHDYGKNWNISKYNSNLKKICYYNKFFLAPFYTTIYFSDDNGLSWHKIQTDQYPFDEIYDFNFTENGIAALTDKGVFNKHLMFGLKQFTICDGASITLKPIPILGNFNGALYLWNTLESADSIIIHPNNNSDYDLKIISENIWDHAQTSVLVKPKILLTIYPPQDTICTGTNLALSASGAEQYLWNTGNTSNSIWINPAQNEQYYVIGKSSGIGCADTVHKNIFVKPPINFKIMGKDTICYGDTAVLNITGADEFYLDYIKFKKTISICPTTTSDYVLAGNNYNSYGCYSSKNLKIVVNPVPEKPSIYKMGNKIVTNSDLQTIWYKNNIPLNYFNGSNCYFYEPGKYQVKTKLNGCLSEISDEINITSADISQIVTVFPNPAKTNITISAPENATILIINSNGKTIKEIENYTPLTELNITDLAPGKYHLKVNYSGKNYFGTFMKY